MDAAGPRPSGAESFIEGIHQDPTELVDALADSPATLVTDDWKIGNLARHVHNALSWSTRQTPGEASAPYDLRW
jgi:hypothetical protein